MHVIASFTLTFMRWEVHSDVGNDGVVAVFRTTNPLMIFFVIKVQ